MTFKAARILVLRNVPHFFTYGVPDNGGDFLVGHIVSLPFGKSVCEGLICEVFEISEFQYETYRSLIAVNSDYLILPSSVTSLLEWFIEFYHLTPYIAYKAVLSSHQSKSLRPLKTKPLLAASIALDLLPEQQMVLDRLITLSHSGFSENLLHGVTGSGKTEVYLQFTDYILKQGKTILVLVPEISLTPQFVERFEARFPGLVAVLHSGLTPVKRLHYWRSAQQGESPIVIGARSAVFAPLDELGAVIIDEAHDLSYKQDRHPRYWTHDIAIYRAQQAQCLLLYGTATPSIEMLYFAQASKINYLEMNARVNARPLPDVNVVDMRAQNQAYGVLSEPLIAAISDTLAKKEKVMILMNRRGYSARVICSKCQSPYLCPECHLGVTYHQDRSYRCHRCSIVFPFSVICKNCQKPGLILQGIGIQKVEWELKRFFPETKILRMDKDTSGTLGKISQVLDEFKKDGDILLGTQMIAKGHDIPQVTLVGILGVDNAMNMPDFSASETSFQLITQVAGRSGRGDQIGKVVVQTYQPEHYAIQCAALHDTHAFFSAEILFRERLGYPPFSKVMVLFFSDQMQSRASKMAQDFTKLVQSHIEKEGYDHQITVLGPRSAPIEFIQGYYRFQTLLKVEASLFLEIKEFLFELTDRFGAQRIIFDFNPRSLM